MGDYISNQNIQRIDLKPEAIEVVSENLAQGFEISKKVQILLKNRYVRMWSPLAEGTPVPTLYQMRYGAKYRTAGSKDFLAPMIKNFLTSSENNHWILENNLVHSDRLPQQSKLAGIVKPFVYNKNVYNLFLKETFSDETIIKTLTFGGGAYPFAGFLTEINLKISQGLKEDRITTEDIQRIAEGTKMVILGAYDEEAFIIVNLS